MSNDGVETLEISTPDGPVEAYLARPAGGDGTSGQDHAHPGVLFFIDALGLRPQIADMVRRIADWGYVVLAPNVLHRSGTVDEVAPHVDLREPGGRDAFMAEAMTRVRALTPELALRDLPHYLAALRGLDGVAPGPIGTTGYCMGARLAVRVAGLDGEVAAVGGWHGGRLVTDDRDSPHRALDSARAEFAFGHADHDPSMPAEAVAALGEALQAAGLRHSNEVYAGAPHGYTMADTSTYDEAAAERHFDTLRAVFDRTLG